MGSKEVGKRTGLLWKLNDKKRAGQLRFHENTKGQENARAGSTFGKYGRRLPADALRRCRERVHGGAEGSSTYCSLEDQTGGPPHMQDDPV